MNLLEIENTVFPCKTHSLTIHKGKGKFNKTLNENTP